MRYGSLCSGIGGLDLAIEEVFGATPAWFCEQDSHAARVLERHWPGVPIYPDLKCQDWTTVEPIDLLCAGYPCQPFSHAGERKGTDDPRHLWPYVADIVRVLRPRIVVLENVAGHVSLGFDVVLADLAALGFDAEWGVVRASDVGACHQRARLFVVAHDAQGDTGREFDGERLRAAPYARSGEPERRGGFGQLAATKGRAEGAAQQRQRVRNPAVDRGAAPADAHGPARRTEGSAGEAVHEPGAVERSGRCDRVAWGDFEPAIRRHEHVIGRRAPDPTDERGRLAVPFVEWMQMLPEGHVDALDRGPALRALGNVVVPPQAAHALRSLVERAEAGGRVGHLRNVRPSRGQPAKAEPVAVSHVLCCAAPRLPSAEVGPET